MLRSGRTIAGRTALRSTAPGASTLLAFTAHACVASVVADEPAGERSGEDEHACGMRARVEEGGTRQVLSGSGPRAGQEINLLRD